jgi:hypothetical protein
MRTEDLPLLTLSGTPGARGRAHGEAFRASIHDLLAGWSHMIEKITAAPVAAVAADFRRATAFEAAFAAHTPGLLEEIEGLAQGAGVERDVLFMFNCSDEAEWYLEHRVRGIDLQEGRGCSSFGVEASAIGCPVIGQNMDIPAAADGHQVLLRIVEADGHQALVFALAGMLGMIGLSNAPVGVVNNALRQLMVRRDGLPVTGMVRGLLAQPDYRAAVEFLRGVPHATGHNWVVGGRDGVSMWECSANQVRQVTHPDSDGRLVHTNHAVANDDAYPDPRFMANRSPSSQARFEALSRAVLPAAAPTDLHSLERALASHADAAHPVCRHVTDSKENFTAGSVIYELSAAPVMHLAPGPPCETRFARFAFDQVDRARQH